MSRTHTLNPPTQGRTRKSKNRRLLLICLLVLIPAGFTMCAYLITRQAGRENLSEALAESDRLDPNWRLAELESSRLPFPEPDKNGINQVLAVRSAMPPTAWPEWPFPQAGNDAARLAALRQLMDASLEYDRLAPTLLNAEQERVLRAEIAHAAPAIELARQMPDFAYGRFPVKWSKDMVSTMLPHVQNVREVANLLSYDGLLRAHDQDLHGALHDVAAILHASRAIGDEETFISQLVRIACDAIAVKLLERSLASGRTSEKDLFSVQRELEAEFQTPFFLAGLRGERANLDLMLECVQDGDISFAKFRRIIITMGPFASFLGGGNLNGLSLEFHSVRMYLNIRGERARHLHYLNEIAELAKLPSWEAFGAIEAKEKAMAANPSFGAGLISSCFKLYVADLRAKAMLRTAYTAVALERFHLARGKWPEKVADLVPQYLSEVPLDPFDGAPLRLTRKGSAIIVYSVSQDRQDQGGVLLANPTAPGSDLGFVLHEPASRRRQGKPFVFPERMTKPAEASDVEQ